jgi:septum formation protein
MSRKRLRPRLILASQSPRRLALLGQLGLTVEVRPADVDETIHAGEAPDAYVLRLALAKAKAAHQPGAITVAADTAVVLDGRVLGKPADREDGVAMLRALAGRTHQVMTGVAVCDDARRDSVCVTTDVEFRDIGEDEADAYWKTGEGADKAGGYGIQGIGGIFAVRIQGSYSAVVGLPLAETERLLRGFGVDIWYERTHG